MFLLTWSIDAVCGGNPTENVQTSRPFQALEDEASSRLALSDRGVLRKGSLALLSPRREVLTMNEEITSSMNVIILHTGLRYLGYWGKEALGR